MSVTADQDLIVKQLDARFMTRVFMVFAGLAVIAGLILLAGRHFSGMIAMAGNTEDTTIREIVTGNNVFHVPSNMIRYERQRADGAQDKLELYVRWPDMTGYKRVHADDFNNASGRHNIVFLTFQEQIMSRDMSGRVEPIYRDLIIEPGIAGPGGLTMHGFKEKTGYLDELLVLGSRKGEPPFAARCLAGEAARQSMAACERDVHVGDHLSLTYRFSRDLLADWRRLDAGVVSLANKLLVTGK